MKLAGLIGCFIAVLLHAGFLLFGGLLIPKAQEPQQSRIVELVGDDSQTKNDKKDEKKEEVDQETAKDQVVKNNDEPAPDAQKIIQSIEAAQAKAPALEIASLSSIESALSGKGAGGDFGEALGFYQGGRIDGKGTKGPLALSDSSQTSFNMSEIDQKPRAIYQSTPEYPTEMRGKKTEGVVVVLFVVDPSGKVTQQRIEQTNNPAFEKPALDAIKKWKFEPGVKGGERVACKMRVSLRFAAS